MNNLKYILKEMNILRKEEAKINYYFEPIYKKESKYWKRHLNYLDLKQDFIQDISNYGFSPYLSKTYKEQRENKNIMKFCKSQNLGPPGYIKKIYKPNKKKEIERKGHDRLNKIKFFNRILDANKRKGEIMERILIKNKDSNNTFLRKIFNKLDNSNNQKNKRQKELTKMKYIKNKILLSPKNEIKIVHFSGNSNIKIIIDDKKKIIDKDDSSFIYEPMINNTNNNLNYKLSIKLKNENKIFKFRKDKNKEKPESNNEKKGFKKLNLKLNKEKLNNIEAPGKRLFSV